jgi:site-specific recombinase XerD
MEITKNVPIFLFYSFNGERLQYFTGKRIDATKWDKSIMRARKGYSESSDINKELDKLAVRIKDIQDKAKALDEELSLEYFREKLKSNGANPGKKSFAECLEEYYENSALTKKSSSMGVIKSTFSVLSKFSKHTGIKLEFKNITMDFYNSLLDYCFNDIQCYNSYTGGLIKNLKAFMEWAKEAGYHTNLDYKRKSFKKLTEESEINFLTSDELFFLYNHKLKGIEHFEEVRDVFCFGCFTGMRYSDILALKPEHVNEDSIRYRVVKTKETNMIPLNPYSKTILDKYKGKLEDRCLPVISQQDTNNTLKELFSEIKLNRKVQKVRFKGAESEKTTYPLSEIITFHISKKTFMTNFLAKGGSLVTAMSITGNTDVRTAQRYYKVVDNLKTDEMNKVFGSLSLIKRKERKKG